MNADPRLPELFAQASELDGEARAAWLAELRGRDEPLAREIEELLAASPADRRFSTPAWERLAPEAADPPPVPQRVGPYRIQREIGRGGMGRVFLAEQHEAEFRRTVAVKLIDRPAAAAEMVRRFRSEVRILAGLEHPGIARFYDAGRAEDGRWFLALEYVEGQDLLTFVRERDLDLRARVELFLEVLDAVDFAHRRLVVHRDLKPGNVLVGADSRPKLLDFGISKIVDPEADDDEATRTELRALTPAYASPEQLRGERATIASDVYSLGVMLHEILTGCRPAVGDDAPGHGLAGDLEAITAKALREEPESRYRSAAAFADDLRRWLKGEPVEARRGGRRYRLAKFVGRHRASVAFASLAILALVAGVAGTLVQAQRAARQAALAREQRDFALRQLSRAEALNDLNSFLFTDAAPQGKPFTVGDLLARAERIVRHQRDAPGEHKAEMMIAVGREYFDQDQIAKSRELLTVAYQLARRNPEPATRARAACALAGVVSREGDFVRAESLVAEGLRQLPDEPQYALHKVFCLRCGGDIARDAEEPEQSLARTLAAQRLLAETHQGSALLQLRVAMDVAESYRIAGRNREASAAFADAARRLAALGRDDSETAGTLFNNWALVVRSLGDLVGAERLFRRAIAIASADASASTVSPMTLTNFGYTLSDLAHLEEARNYADRAYALAEKQGDEVSMIQASYLRARAGLRLGDVAGTTRLLAELEPRVKRAFPPGHPYLASLESQKALLAQASGDFAGAAAAHDRAIAAVEATSQEPYLASLLLRRSGFQLDAGRPAQAAADAARSLALYQKSADPAIPSSWVGHAQLALGRALLAEGKRSEARAILTKALAQLVPSIGVDHPDSRAARELALAAARP